MESLKIMENKMTNDLLPCPFCGTSDLRTVWTDFGVDHTPMNVSIACNECLAELPPCLTEDEAIKAWNTRTPSKSAEADWIKAQPHETYDGLKKQFSALKTMLNSMGEQLSFYLKKDYSLSEKRLAALEESLESERAMNAKLTEENGHLATGKGGDLVPGAMRCAKCNFRLQRNNLYMQSGTIGPGNNKTEPCPNGCGPIWPVTWKEDALEGDKHIERLMNEIADLKAEQQKTAEPCGDK